MQRVKQWSCRSPARPSEGSANGRCFGFSQPAYAVGRTEPSGAASVPPGRQPALRHQRVQGERGVAVPAPDGDAQVQPGGARGGEHPRRHHSDPRPGAGHRPPRVAGPDQQLRDHHRVQHQGAGLPGALGGAHRQHELGRDPSATQGRRPRALPDRGDPGGQAVGGNHRRGKSARGGRTDVRGSVPRSGGRRDPEPRGDQAGAGGGRFVGGAQAGNPLPGGGRRGNDRAQRRAPGPGVPAEHALRGTASGRRAADADLRHRNAGNGRLYPDGGNP